MLKVETGKAILSSAYTNYNLIGVELKYNLIPKRVLAEIEIIVKKNLKNYVTTLTNEITKTKQKMLKFGFS